MELVQTLRDPITDNIFIGYGIFSITYILVCIFIKNHAFIDKLDESSNKIIIFSGLIYFLLWMIGMYFSFKEINSEEEKYRLLNRMFGPYWFGYWLQPVLWILITQLMWFKKIRRLKILRIVMSVILAVPFEKVVILITSLHRDYVPASHVSYFSVSVVIIGIFAYLVLYSILVTIFYLISEKIKLAANTK
jgi:hypothetical protein